MIHALLDFHGWIQFPSLLLSHIQFYKTYKYDKLWLLKLRMEKQGWTLFTHLFLNLFNRTFLKWMRGKLQAYSLVLDSWRLHKYSLFPLCSPQKNELAYRMSEQLMIMLQNWIFCQFSIISVLIKTWIECQSRLHNAK